MEFFHSVRFIGMSAHYCEIGENSEQGWYAVVGLFNRNVGQKVLP